MEQLLLYYKKTHIYQSYQLTTIVYPFVRACVHAIVHMYAPVHACLSVSEDAVYFKRVFLRCTVNAAVTAEARRW